MNSTDVLNTTEASLECSGHNDGSVSTSVVVTAVIQGLIAGVGLLGNAIVIIVLILARDRRDTSSIIYVLNLAVADFFFLATVPFKISQAITLHWKVGEFMCKFAGGFLTYLNFFVSPLFLMVMSIDRYLAVNKAVSSAKLRALKSSRYVSAAVWTVAVIAVLPPSAFQSTLPGGFNCKPRFPGSIPPPTTEDFCTFQKRFEECTNEFIQNHTTQFSTGVSLADNITPLSRYKREIEATTRVTKNKKGRRKNGGKKKKKRRKPKRKKMEKSDVDMTSHLTFPTGVPDSLILADEPVSLIKATTFDEVSTDQPLDVTTGHKILTSMAFTKILENNVSPTVNVFEGPMSEFPSMRDNFSLDVGDELKGAASAACFAKLWSGTAVTGKCFLDESFSFLVWIVLNFFYSYLIPCGVIVVCYMAILRKLYQPSRIVQSHSRGSSRRQAVRKKVTVMVAMLVISYMICFTPYYIWQLANVPGVPVSSPRICQDVRRFNATMAYANSALNPLLYTFLSDQFATKFRLAWNRIVRRTEYRIGTVLTARNKNGNSAKRKSGKKDQAAVPVELKLNDNREDERHLMEANNEGERANHNKKVVIAEVEQCKDEQNTNEPNKKNSLATAGTAGYTSSSQNQKSSSTKTKEADDVEKNVDKVDATVDKKRCHLGGHRASGGNKLLLCLKNCSLDEHECPHCAVEMSEMQPADDVFDDGDDVKNERHDVICDLVPTSPNGKDDTLDKTQRHVSANDSSFSTERGSSSSGGKLCKKHKRSMRGSMRSKGAKDALPPEMDSGRWRTASSVRSESKFPTEMTAITTSV